MTPRALSGIPFVLLLAACQTQNPSEAEPAPSKAAPVVVLPPSKLRTHPGATRAVAPATTGSAGTGFGGVTTDGRETQAGYDAHVGLAKECKDQSCFGQRCPKLCTQWIAENAKSLPTANHKNTAYFRCFGACLAGPPDAGAK